MFYQLPPVGNRVQLSAAGLQQNKNRSIEGLFSAIAPDYQTALYASGTAALAVALQAVLQLRDDAATEILLPAYACPDLISAVVYAGGTPVLVDLEAERPWMDLRQLQQKLTTNTAAVIAVNLFGISERISDIQQLASKVGAFVIEDSAQGFPTVDEQEYWQADIVVLSFGRGKPVSLLGGGAVLCKQNNLYAQLPVCNETDAGVMERLRYRIKASIYNALISPRCYWLPASLPFLHLGETRYHPLDVIASMPGTYSQHLAGNAQHYQNAPLNIQNSLVDIVESSGVIDCVNLPLACDMNDGRRLLRYPMLVGADHRSSLQLELERAGLGVSVLYPAILPQIDGLKQMLAGQGEFPNAADFASRLLTLPTHGKVKPGDCEQIRRILA